MKVNAAGLMRRLSWRRRLTTIIAFLMVAALGGFLYVWAGLAPISARSGHWPITAWVLHSAMRQGVETRVALGVEKLADVDLDDPVLALRGAPHFASGCAPCHGAPGVERAAIAEHMTPEPPRLEDRIPEWEDEELFWIVRNGVKFSAMPAWPAEGREDEVWSMVAFLRRLPDMTNAEWRAIAGIETTETAAGSLDAGVPDDAVRMRRLTDPVSSILAESCARCHGLDGLGRGEGAFPKLAGQKKAYLEASLAAYAEEERASGFMKPPAAMLSREEMADLAAYFAALDPGPPAEAPEEADLALGAAIAGRGVPERGIPACASCHGPGTAELYPDIAGQYARYLEIQLETFRDGERGGTPFAHIMHTAAKRLTDAEIDALAAYYATRTPGN